MISSIMLYEGMRPLQSGYSDELAILQIRAARPILGAKLLGGGSAKVYGLWPRNRNRICRLPELSVG